MQKPNDATDEQQYENDLPLERLFSNATARVLDFLILNQRFDYSASDISRLAEVPSRTLDRVLPKLIDEHLVKHTRKSGKSPMYILNSESERALALQQYCKATIKENVENPQFFVDANRANNLNENETLME